MTNLINNFPELLTSCRFYLELKLTGSKDPVDAYFLECKGFKRTQEVIEVCEVTPQKWGLQGTTSGRIIRTKVPGNVKNNNIVLRRGLTVSTTLWKWFDAVQLGQWANKNVQNNQRRDGALTIYSQAGIAQATFVFQRAWPVSYTVTDFNSSSNELEIEELEIAVEEFMREDVTNRV
ncbi:MAG: phage tail protein [Desertifilum sp.]|nr:phage tail protein [Desertifilum sp.]